MTQSDFGSIMAYLGTAVGKPPTREQTEVYFDLLSDLAVERVREGARRAVLEHRYASIPPVGLIRSHAAAIGTCRTPGPKAWQLAVESTRYRKPYTGVRLGTPEEFEHEDERESIATLPDDVAGSVRAFGWKTIRDYGHSPITQTQFIKAHESLDRHESQAALTPPAHPVVASIVCSLAERMAIGNGEKK